MGERSGKESKPEHDGRRIEEDPRSRAGAEALQARREQVGYPAVRAQFRRGQQNHGQQKKDKHRSPERPKTESERDGRHQRVERRCQQGSIGRENGRAKNEGNLIDGIAREYANDQASGPAEFFHHLRVGNVGGNSFLHGKFLADHHQSIPEGWEKEEADLPTPPEIVECDEHKTTEHEPSGPARVEHDEA